MKHSNWIEIFLGFFVFSVAAVTLSMFILFSKNQIFFLLNGGKGVLYYPVYANFNDVGGVRRGDSVVIGGVKIGTVGETRILGHQARLELLIQKDLVVSSDTTVAVSSGSLFGGRVIVLKPGRLKDAVGPEGTLKNTVDYKSLEDSIQEIIFLATD